MPTSASPQRDGDRPSGDDLGVPIALPEPKLRMSQDVEWCLARVDGEWREFRFHDYHEMYEVEGLYERVFYDVLECQSPQRVCALLSEQLAKAEVPADGLRVLDLGAGNGIVGEQLVALGAGRVVGVDILPEAAEAAARDRDGVYADYHVVDMTRLDRDEHAALRRHGVNCLTCVAALGFGDIPPEAFRAAYNLIPDGGWVAFTIKEDFLDGHDGSGFSGLIRRSIADGELEVLCQERYPHRLSTSGEPLHYVAIVGRKQAPIPHSSPEDAAG